MKNIRMFAGAMAALAAFTPCAAAMAAHSAAAIVIWRIAAPQSASKDVQATEAGLVAINFIDPQLAALSRHSGAKVTLALDPAFVDSLERAASGQSALASLAAGTTSSSDRSFAELRSVMAAAVVPSIRQVDTRAASRFASATAARLVLRGDAKARISHADDVDYASAAVLLSLAASNYAYGPASLLGKSRLDAGDLAALSGAFRSACRDLIARLRKASSSGAVELAALPAYEPIMPLVIDAAGRTERVPFTVVLNAAADVGDAVDQGIQAVRTLDPSARPGIISPSGAYDDNTAMLLQGRHASYGVFSERVVKMNVGAAAQSVAEAHSAAFRAYLLETSKTSSLPILFCSDAASTSIDAQSPVAPASAMADRFAAVVASAVAAAPKEAAPVVVLCLSATGAILHRSDRAAALDALAAALGGARLRASTPRRFLADHPPTTDTYGYEATSEAGGFGLWMGSQSQMSLWNALADARTAAGGDAALANPEAREALLRAESGRWFMDLALPQPRAVTEASLGRFRELVAQIYRAAKKPIPRNIAPVNLDKAPQPSPTLPAT